MEDFNEPHSEYEERTENKAPYQSRMNKHDKESRVRRWVKPLVILVIMIMVLSTAWYFGSRIQITLPGWLREGFPQEEEKIQITLPSALFADKDVEEIIKGSVREDGLEEIVQGENGSLTLTMTAEVREGLLEEAEEKLKEKIAVIRDKRRHPYVVSISYDSSYKDYYLIVQQEQSNRALVTASELFMLAVYYQLISASAEIGAVSILIEDAESGSLFETIDYPDDLSRLATILEEDAVTDDEVRTPRAGDKVVVSTGPDNLNLRNGPEITYLIIDILRSGTVLEVTGTEGVWLEVITPENKEGWVHGDFVEIYLEDN